MAFALVFIGLIMVVTGVRNTYSAFGTQVTGDAKGFIPWVAAILAVGALGYIKELRTFSHMFLALIIISMLLANKGFFANLTTSLKQAPTAPASNTTSTTTPNASNTPASPADSFGQSVAKSLNLPSWLGSILN